jgi:hypothetical protein
MAANARCAPPNAAYLAGPDGRRQCMTRQRSVALPALFAAHRGWPTAMGALPSSPRLQLECGARRERIPMCSVTNHRRHFPANCNRSGASGIASYPAQDLKVGRVAPTWVHRGRTHRVKGETGRPMTTSPLDDSVSNEMARQFHDSHDPGTASVGFVCAMRQDSSRLARLLRASHAAGLRCHGTCAAHPTGKSTGSDHHSDGQSQCHQHRSSHSRSSWLLRRSKGTLGPQVRVQHTRATRLWPNRTGAPLLVISRCAQFGSADRRDGEGAIALPRTRLGCCPGRSRCLRQRALGLHGRVDCPLATWEDSDQIPRCGPCHGRGMGLPGRCAIFCFVTCVY